jgi:hypothetical protein
VLAGLPSSLGTHPLDYAWPRPCFVFRWPPDPRVTRNPAPAAGAPRCLAAGAEGPGPVWRPRRAAGAFDGPRSVSWHRATGAPRDGGLAAGRDSGHRGAWSPGQRARRSRPRLALPGAGGTSRSVPGLVWPADPAFRPGLRRAGAEASARCSRRPPALAGVRRRLWVPAEAGSRGRHPLMARAMGGRVPGGTRMSLSTLRRPAPHPSRVLQAGHQPKLVPRFQTGFPPPSRALAETGARDR